MFPLNFWTDETKKSSLPTTAPYTVGTSPKHQQSETETSHLLKIRDLLSSSNKQKEIQRKRQIVLGFDNRD
jgi:hypothetical protein